MTIHVEIKNLDSRQNAIVAVTTTDTYKTGGVLTQYHKVIGHLKGGEKLETYLTDSQTVQVIETQNG